MLSILIVIKFPKELTPIETSSSAKILTLWEDYDNSSHNVVENSLIQYEMVR